MYRNYRSSSHHLYQMCKRNDVAAALLFPTEFEAGFIRLLDKLTNGSRIEVNETGERPSLSFRLTSKFSRFQTLTGTSVFYHPGLLMGGTLEHSCSLQRSIGYSLEPLMLLAPFSKKPLRITLRGLTNGPNDPSVIILHLLFTHTHRQMYTHAYTHAHTCLHTHIQSYIHTYIQTHIHTHIHTSAPL